MQAKIEKTNEVCFLSYKIQLFFSRCSKKNVLRYIFGPVYNKELRTFERKKINGSVWRAENYIIKKALTETMYKKKPLGIP